MRVFLILAGSLLSTAAAASPPPPPPGFIVDIAKHLVPSPTAATFDSYARLFADDLVVTQDGKTIAASKRDWLAIERRRIGKVDRLVYGHAEGGDSILVFDRFDDRSDLKCPTDHTCIFDPRYHARAVQYQLGADRLVHAIRIVQTDGILRTP